VSRYRIEIRQGDKVLFAGPWAEEMIDHRLDFEEMTEAIKDGNEGRLSTIMKSDGDGNMVIIPKNILINSLVVLTKEKGNVEPKKKETRKK